MAFIVEDGTGIKGATSYATVQFFKDYFADRPDDVTGIADATIQTLLVEATDYIDTRWGLRFKGKREYLELLSRSVLTLTAQPSDGETVTFGSNTYTFRTTADPAIDTEVEIGIDTINTLERLANAIGLVDNDDFGGSRFADPDVAALTLFALTDGVTTTETLANGSFDNASTTGRSRQQQPLEFPRDCLRDKRHVLIVGVPERLKEATAEYALRANTADLAPDPTIDATGLRRTKDRTKVGPIETEVEFAEGVSPRITKPYPAADRLLQEFVRAPGVIRA